MGRQRKQGLKYCHLDVDFLQDIKVRKLIRLHGAAAPAVYMAALCQVFTRGYFAQAHGIAYLVAEALNLQEKYVIDVFNSAAELQLFDNNLYRNEGIISSISIQRRYIEQCKAMRRNIDVQAMPYRLFEQSDNSNVTQKTKQPLQRDIFSSEEIILSSEEKSDSRDLLRKNQENYGKNQENYGKNEIIPEEKNHRLKILMSPTTRPKLFPPKKKIFPPKKKQKTNI